MNIYYYWKFFTELWRFFKKHSISSTTDWEKIVNEAHQINEKYTGEFVEKMLLASIDELERLEKIRIKEKE